MYHIQPKFTDNKWGVLERRRLAFSAAVFNGYCLHLHMGSNYLLPMHFSSQILLIGGYTHRLKLCQGPWVSSTIPHTKTIIFWCRLGSPDPPVSCYRIHTFDGILWSAFVSFIYILKHREVEDHIKYNPRILGNM